MSILDELLDNSPTRHDSLVDKCSTRPVLSTITRSLDGNVRDNLNCSKGKKYITSVIDELMDL